MMIFKTLTVTKMLVLPALIRVEYEPIEIVELLKGLVKHIINLFKIRVCRDIV